MRGGYRVEWVYVQDRCDVGGNTRGRDTEVNKSFHPVKTGVCVCACVCSPCIHPPLPQSLNALTVLASLGRRSVRRVAGQWPTCATDKVEA